MASPLEALEPKSIWREFDELRKIPRASKHEQRARAHVKGLFAGRGWSIREDATGNMVVQVPATAGYEKGAVTILQAHLDMVNEKDSGVAFDWDKDPIAVWIDGDWVKARGTTLGADNGVGVAAALSSALDPSVKHGPLELLFTVDEETGLTGALGLDPAMLSGRRLINLDSEEDGALYVGCAGGASATLTFDAKMTAPPTGAVGARIQLTGLNGGHSGSEIHENRGNAIKLMTRFLARALGGAPEAGAPAGRNLDVDLAAFTGGDKHNAIPRESVAHVAVPRASLEDLKALAASEVARGLLEFRTSDPHLAITVEDAPLPGQVLARPDRDRLLALLAALPSGVLAMSRDIKGLVETSNNLASIRQDGERFKIVSSTRSSVPPALRAALDQVAATARLAGARVEEKDGYPGWLPNMKSPLLATCRRVHNDLYGQEPTVATIHAGLETGLIGKKVPGIDMISYGPEIKDPHSPKERVQISSVDRFWKYHRAVLEALASA